MVKNFLKEVMRMGWLTMYMRETVKAGSTITLSPDEVVITKLFVRLYCSAINGEMFDLKRPVPFSTVSPRKKKKKTVRRVTHRDR